MTNILPLTEATRTIPLASKPRLTLKTVKAELAAVGVKITKRDDEFRVVMAGEGEEQAYYTDDLPDALATGKDMARRAEGARKAREAATGTVYRLGSNPMVYAPGIVAWVRSGFWHKPDRQALLKVLRETWNLPAEVALAIASTKEGHTDSETDAFVFEFKG